MTTRRILERHLITIVAFLPYAPFRAHSLYRSCFQLVPSPVTSAGSSISQKSLIWDVRRTIHSKLHCRVNKARVGDLLVEQGLATDIKHATALIMARSVIADESVLITSAAQKLDVNTPLRLRGQKTHSWVSRGGLKLEHAITEFNLTVQGQIAVDIGCSTGGFTHVLLQSGARRVYAVDVGYGQLALPLRNDPRVVVLERTNARNLTTKLIPDVPSVVTCDASFIPLHKVLPAAMALCKAPGALLLALIKPQFEAERHEIESGTGVVRSEEVRQRVCDQVVKWLDELPPQTGGKWRARGVTKSPIQGPNGNVEFILYAELA